MQLHVRVIDDADILADLAATAIARSLQAAMADHDGPVSLFLSGGSTPRVTYTRLVDQEVDWSRVHVFLGDERWVDTDHQDSNARIPELGVLIARQRLGEHQHPVDAVIADLGHPLEQSGIDG